MALMAVSVFGSRWLPDEGKDSAAGLSFATPFLRLALSRERLSMFVLERRGSRASRCRFHLGPRSGLRPPKLTLHQVLESLEQINVCARVVPRRRGLFHLRHCRLRMRRGSLE